MGSLFGVRISKISPSTSRRLLELYFKNTRKSGGGRIKNLIYDSGQDTAVVIFEEDYIHWQVTERRQHSINDAAVDVELVIPAVYDGSEPADAGRDTAECLCRRTTLDSNEVKRVICPSEGNIAGVLQECCISMTVSSSSESENSWLCTFSGSPNAVDHVFNYIDWILSGPEASAVAASHAASADNLTSGSQAPAPNSESAIDRALTEPARRRSRRRGKRSVDGHEDETNPSLRRCTTAPGDPKRRIAKQRNASTRRGPHAAPPEMPALTVSQPADKPLAASTSASADVAKTTEGSLPQTIELANAVSGPCVPVELTVPKYVTPFILGRSGKTVKSLESTWGVTIRIAPLTSNLLGTSTHRGSKSPNSRCIIEGKLPADVAAARAAIESIMMAHSFDSYPQLTDPGHEGKPTTAKISEWIRQPRGFMIIPERSCGLIIGKGGESIRKIQTVSGASSIRFQEHACRADVKVCNIVGTKESIRIAFALIAQRLKWAFYPEFVQQTYQPILLDDMQEEDRGISLIGNQYYRSSSLFVSNLSSHTSTEAILCWLRLATGHFPAEVYVSLGRTELVAQFENTAIDEERTITFAASNTVDGQTLKVKLLQATTRIQVHGIPQNVGIVELLEKLEESHLRTVAGERLLKSTAVFVVQRMPVKLNSFRIQSLSPDEIRITPHYDELGILRPEQVLSGHDLSYADFLENQSTGFTLPCLVVSGLSNKVDREVLASYLKNTRKSCGGDIQNLFITENRAVVQFKDPAVVDRVHAKYMTDGLAIADMQLQVAMVKAPSPGLSSDRLRLRVKNICEATVDSLKYVLWVSCDTAVREIQLVWTNDQELQAIVTFKDEIGNVAMAYARMCVMTLDGRSLEAEETIPCTSLMIQNVPADMHKESLELVLEGVVGDDVGPCEKVAAHTWLAEFKHPQSFERLLSHGINYSDVNFHVTADQQDFVPIADIGQYHGRRGRAKLKLDFLTSSLLNFITTTRRDELHALMEAHCARPELDANGAWTAYFLPPVREHRYWELHKMWRQLKHAILQIASQFVTDKLLIVTALAKAWNMPLPHFHAFRSTVLSKSSDVQLRVCDSSDSSAGVLELVGLPPAVREARAVFEQSLCEPCHLELGGSHCCHEITHVEHCSDELSLALVDAVDFGKTHCNNGMSVQLLVKENEVVLRGLCVDVQQAFSDLRAILCHAVSKEIQGSKQWVDLMKRDAVRSYIGLRFRAEAAELESNVVWCVIAPATVRVLATRAAFADKGMAIIRAAVVDRLIPMGPSFISAAKTDVWCKTFRACVDDKYGDSVMLVVCEDIKQLQLTCCAGFESYILADLYEFQRLHTLTSSFLELPDAVAGYISTYCKYSIEEIEKDLFDKLVKIHNVHNGHNSVGGCTGFKLEGNEEGVARARTAMENLQSKCKLQSRRLDVPGAGAYFASSATQVELLHSIGDRTKTMVRICPQPPTLADDSADCGHSDASAIHGGSSNMARDTAGSNSVAGMMRQGKACMVKGTYVNVCLGDISEESSTIVVNCTDNLLSLHGQVSRALVSKGGPTITAECKLRGAIDSSGILMTSSGSLKCECIMHVDIRLDCETIVQKCLKKAEECGAESIAFPSIGTGAAGKPVAAVSRSMVEAAVKFLKSQEHKHLKLVKFVIFDQSLIHFFEKALITVCSPKKKGLMDIVRELKARLDARSAGNGGSYLQTYAEYFGFSRTNGNYGESSVVNGALSLAAVTVVSPMAAGVTTPKSKIIDFDNSLEEQPLVQPQVDGITQAVRDAVKELPRATAAFYSICGASAEEINSALQQLLTTCTSKLKTRTIKEPKEVISALTESQISSIANLGAWLDVSIEVDSTEHEINMTSLDESSLSLASECLRDALLKQRRDGAQVRCTPPTWSITDGYATRVVGMWTDEHKRVARALHDSLGSSRLKQCLIISITRVENMPLWQQYVAYKKKVKGTMAPSSPLAVERMLWHGTTEEAVESICHGGFNRSYCGKNAVVYGQGVYFARDASYSAQDTYSVPNSRGEKCIIYSNVVTGEYEVGNSQIRVPKKKPHHSIATYECTVDNTQNPTVFVTYNDSQAYPAYVLRFVGS